MGKGCSFIETVTVVIHRAEDARAGTEEKRSTNIFPLCSNKDALGAGDCEALQAEGACVPSPFQKPKHSSHTRRAWMEPVSGLLAEHRAHLLGKIPALLLTATQEQLGFHRRPGATTATSSLWLTSKGFGCPCGKQSVTFPTLAVNYKQFSNLCIPN